MGTTEYGPGDVVYFPSGPFSGICAVVRTVDPHREELRIDFAEGLTHREGGVLHERRHTFTVRFDEVELV
ncbi:hypothetical protein [Nocardia sp. NPDC005825]|uniref:hypothetical protein n=1 Tax=unclassified Nocardia TaxID=2637762 RepID=UPI0033C0E705